MSRSSTMPAEATPRSAGEGGEASRRTRNPSAASSTPNDEDEALENATGAEAVGIPSLRGLVGGVLKILAQPAPAAREATRLSREQLSIARGRSALAPSPKDKRFSDPAWSLNPGYRRLCQTYLNVGGSLARLVDDYEAGGKDWHDTERARFAVQAMTSLLAPTNTLFGNPAAVKRTFDTGGRSVARGLGHLLHDLRHNGGMPSQTDRTAFTVGKDLALTRGAVVHRDEVGESSSTPRAPPLSGSDPCSSCRRRSGASTSWTCGRDAASWNTP